MITYQLFEAGFCKHCERMTLSTGKLSSREYPALCALIHHPVHGHILFDTGYSDRFFSLTKNLPSSLYRYLTPMTLNKSLQQQLMVHGIMAEDIQYIVISHFHADHIGGLKDFPNARFICHKLAVEDIQQARGLKALLKGFLPGLLPYDFYERLIVLDQNEIQLENALHPFLTGFDLFGDKQLIAIPLPGHAKGQIGLYLNSEKESFLIADSCWHTETFEQLIYPSNLTYVIHDNKADYIETIEKLHELYQHNKDILIIPSHCMHMRQVVTGGKSC